MVGSCSHELLMSFLTPHCRVSFNPFTFLAPCYLFLRNRCVITGDHRADGVSGSIDHGRY